MSVIAPQIHHGLLPHVNQLGRTSCVRGDSSQVKIPIPQQLIGGDASATLVIFTDSIQGNDAKIFAVMNKTGIGCKAGASYLPTFLAINDGIGTEADPEVVADVQRQIRYYQDAIFPQASWIEHSTDDSHATLRRHERHAYCRFMCQIPWRLNVPFEWIEPGEMASSGAFTPRPTSALCPLLRSVVAQWKGLNDLCGCARPDLSVQISSRSTIQEQGRSLPTNSAHGQLFWFVGCSVSELDGTKIYRERATEADGGSSTSPLTSTVLSDVNEVLVDFTKFTATQRGLYLALGEMLHIGAFVVSTKMVAELQMPGYFVEQSSAVDLYRSFPLPATADNS